MQPASLKNATCDTAKFSAKFVVFANFLGTENLQVVPYMENLQCSLQSNLQVENFAL